MIVRNTAEFVFIIGVWAVMQALLQHGVLGSFATLTVIVVSVLKTAFFGIENIRQLFESTRSNQPYYRFMMLMLLNMTQIILSFGLDFHCLSLVNPQSFSVDLTEYTLPETIFEFLYFSTLNFTFFGYGDMTPQTVAAKLMTMTEIVLAFVTVIFLLSDFISLKESLRNPPPGSSSNTPG